MLTKRMAPNPDARSGALGGPRPYTAASRGASLGEPRWRAHPGHATIARPPASVGTAPVAADMHPESS
ncbi:MAG: hypothetical protein RIR43_331 [Pseudomonadota bacterium]